MEVLDASNICVGVKKKESFICHVTLIFTLSTGTEPSVVTYQLDDVGHTVPVCQFDVLASIHQSLVSLKKVISKSVNHLRQGHHVSCGDSCLSQCVCLICSRTYKHNDIAGLPHE